MLDLPIEYLTAIGAVCAAVAWVTRAYITDLKESNTYLRDTIAKTTATQQSTLESLERKMDGVEDGMDGLEEIAKDILSEYRQERRTGSGERSD